MDKLMHISAYGNQYVGVCECVLRPCVGIATLIEFKDSTCCSLAACYSLVTHLLIN